MSKAGPSETRTYGGADIGPHRSTGASGTRDGTTTPGRGSVFSEPPDSFAMDVHLLEATDDPEELVCRAARNDYMSEFNARLSFEETMREVDGDDAEAKKRTLIAHLLNHGHSARSNTPTPRSRSKGSAGPAWRS